MVDDLNGIIHAAREIGIKNIELGANVKHGGRDSLREIIKKNTDLEFFVHHYFPAPQRPFVCNVGHPDTVEPSRKFIEDNVKMCGMLNISNYSVHAGYGINPSPGQLGGDQSSLQPIPYEQSLELFIHTAAELEKFGEKHDVQLLWENNVVADSNRFNTKRSPYLFSDTEFLHEMKNNTWWKNARVLLDIGHLKVSARTLGFDSEEFIKKIEDKVVHIHLSENNGLEDTNLPITKDTFSLLGSLKRFANLEAIFLEVYRIPQSEIQAQIKLIESWFLERIKIENTVC